MIRTITLAFISFAAAPFAGAQGPMAVAGEDLVFLQKAAAGGTAEVQLGQLAQQRGTAPAVKDFAQRMVTDHTKVNDRLQSLAADKGVAVTGALEQKDQALYTRIAKLSGDAFDKAYMSAMIADHTEDVSDFRKESQSARDAQIRSFASSTLPTLEEHLRMAKQIGVQVGAEPPTEPSR